MAKITAPRTTSTSSRFALSSENSVERGDDESHESLGAYAPDRGSARRSSILIHSDYHKLLPESIMQRIHDPPPL